jgi:hypothetical protein
VAIVSSASWPGLTRPSLAIRDSVPIGQHRGDRA